jgi:hypothetical protein
VGDAWQGAAIECEQKLVAVRGAPCKLFVAARRDRIGGRLRADVPSERVERIRKKSGFFSARRNFSGNAERRQGEIGHWMMRWDLIFREARLATMRKESSHWIYEVKSLMTARDFRMCLAYRILKCSLKGRSIAEAGI